MIRIVSLQNDPPRACFAALAGFELDPTITDADPRAAALVAALPHGCHTLYFGRFEDGRLGVMGSGHPDVPVAIETAPPANGKAHYTTRDVAESLGITTQRVRDLVFRAADLPVLAEKRRPGRRKVET